MTQMTAPTIPTQQTQPASAQPVAGQEQFDDLPPDVNQDQGVTPESAQPTGPAQAADDEEIDIGAMDFETLLSAAQQPVAVTPQAPVAPATQVQPAAVAPQPGAVAPVQPAAAVPAQVPPQQVQPQAAQPQPAQVPGQPQPQAAPAQPVDQAQVFDSLRQGVEKNRQVLVEQVASHYASTLSDEDVDLLQTEPKKALSMMAARVHVDGLQNILAVISSNLPSMVNAVVEGQRLQAEAANSFYSEYSGFDRAAHSPTINQIAQTVRQMNPQMEATQFKAMVATIAAQTLGIPLQRQAQAAQPQQPQQPQMRAPRGFAPAGASQVPQQQVRPNGAGNPWEAMAEMIQADDK